MLGFWGLGFFFFFFFFFFSQVYFGAVCLVTNLKI